MTEFRVRRAFLQRFEVQRVGAQDHLEYWIPAEALDEFNDNIVGKIAVAAEFRGSR